MKKPILDAEQETLLRNQVFDDTQPGPILHDFQLVLDHVGEKGVKAGGKYNLLPIEAIPVLDPKLSRPLNLDLKRPQLRSHPYLQGLHLLLRASGLVQAEGKGDKARLVQAPEALARWNDMSPTERYFSLLEAWLLVARSEMVGMDRSFHDSLLLSVQQMGNSLLHARDRHSRLGALHSLRESCQIALVDLFGLVRLKGRLTASIYDSDVRGEATPFGTALLRLLVHLPNYITWFELADEDAEDEDEADAGEEDEVGEEAKAEEDLEEEGGFGSLQRYCQPYFPEWQKTLAAPEPEFRDGVFVFKVSLGDVWRTMALSAQDTLDDLMGLILRSVNFDSEHLYSFTYRDHLGRMVRALHPYCDDGLPADEVQLGKLPLKVGESMKLVYDFGDDWRFDVTLERIDPPGTKGKLPRIIEKHGKSPEQYPSWD
jgi:hypothetical protein